MSSKRVLVCGAGGFIGGHLVQRLKQEGFWVRGADIKRHEFSQSVADEFLLGDLTDVNNMGAAVAGIDEVYQQEKWGADSEAVKRTTNLAHELDKAVEMIDSLRA